VEKKEFAAFDRYLDGGEFLLEHTSAGISPPPGKRLAFCPLAFDACAPFRASRSERLFPKFNLHL
jgi:hypothetical protein